MNHLQVIRHVYFLSFTHGIKRIQNFHEISIDRQLAHSNSNYEYFETDQRKENELWSISPFKHNINIHKY